MKKTLVIITITLSAPFLLFGTALAAGNGTMSAGGSPGLFSAITATFTHDTSYGTLNSTAIVVWNAAGTVEQFMTSSTGSYFYANGTKNLNAISPPVGLAAGNYRMAAISLNSSCCTNAQMETLWTTETDTNTNSSGFYYPVNFTVTAPPAPSPVQGTANLILNKATLILKNANLILKN